MKGPFRADHVGSLLRPETLLEKRQEWKEDRISDGDLRSYEDECIAEIVKKVPQCSHGVGKGLTPNPPGPPYPLPPLPAT